MTQIYYACLIDPTSSLPHFLNPNISSKYLEKNLISSADQISANANEEFLS